MQDNTRRTRKFRIESQISTNMISKRATYFIQKKLTELKPKEEMENLIHTHTHYSQFNNKGDPRVSRYLLQNSVDHEVIPLLGRFQSNSKICRSRGTTPPLHSLSFALHPSAWAPCIPGLFVGIIICHPKWKFGTDPCFCLRTDSGPLGNQMQIADSKSLFPWPHQLSSELLYNLLSWPSPVLYSDIQVAFSWVNLVFTCWELFFIITMSLKIKNPNFTAIAYRGFS